MPINSQKFPAVVTPHCYFKTTATIFFLQRFNFVEKQGFSAMESYSFFFICEFNMVFCKANCSWKDWFRDRWVKLCNIKLLFSIILNQSITFSEFFHWLNCSLFLKFRLTLSKIDLLILPMSLFDGLVSRQGKDDWNFGLWSFNDINAVFLQGIRFCCPVQLSTFGKIV